MISLLPSHLSPRRIDRTFVVLIPIGPLCRDPSKTISCFFVNLGHCGIRHENIAFDSVTWRWRTVAKNWTSCLLYTQLQAYELFLTAENNFRRVGISDLQKSQVTSLGKTKFDSLERRRVRFFRLDALALSVIATATWLGGWVAGWLAGWVAVTLRYCIKTAKPIGKLFRPSESPIILVF